MEDLENYQIAHFRLLSDSNFLPYGKSMLEGARRVWKQLSLMEDAMLIHRIMRAPEKRIFKIGSYLMNTLFVTFALVFIWLFINNILGFIEHS